MGRGTDDEMLFAFDEFELDAARCELRRSGGAVRVEPKAFDLLLLLVRHRDRVVRKEELLRALWPDLTLSRGVLTRCVWSARRALGDDGRRQAVIRTVHGRGYRFVASLAAGARGGYGGGATRNTVEVPSISLAERT